MYYEIQYYLIGNIVRDIKLTFNNKEYMVNNFYSYRMELNLFQSFGKTIYTENFSIIIATNFDNLMSVASLVEIRSSLYLRIFGLT